MISFVKYKVLKLIFVYFLKICIYNDFEKSDIKTNKTMWCFLKCTNNQTYT